MGHIPSQHRSQHLSRHIPEPSWKLTCIGLKLGIRLGMLGLGISGPGAWALGLEPDESRCLLADPTPPEIGLSTPVAIAHPNPPEVAALAPPEPIFTPQLEPELEAGCQPISAAAQGATRDVLPPVPIAPAAPDLLLAAPDNLNPDLLLPPPLPRPLPTPADTMAPATPALQLESLDVDVRRDDDNFDRLNQIIEPTARFRLRNGDIVSLKTGFNWFNQPEVEAIANIPLQLGWERRLNDQITLRAAAGADFFDRLPTATSINGQIDARLSPSLTLSAVVEQAPYKFNARTLDNQITAWRFGPNLYWQIDPQTSLFSLLRFGTYNDGNDEQQSFSRLEHKIGQFSVAANLFNWSYFEDVEQTSGYFSPPDFLVATGELAWEGAITDGLRCRVAASFGVQRLLGAIDNASALQGRCTVRLTPNMDVDLGYALSNVQNRSDGSSIYQNESFTGNLRMRF